MPKQMLSGSLDEQCQFLYDLGIEKFAQGNYTGAVHAFREIIKYAPDFRDTEELLAIAQQRKSEQRFLVLSAIIGGVVMVAIGSVLQLRNDLYLLAFALVGTLVGYFVGAYLNYRRQTKAQHQHSER